MYPLPAWRRVLFIAVLVVVIVITFAPSTAQGTVNVRLYGLSAPSVVNHVYVGLAKVQLHETGLPFDSDRKYWVTISQGFSAIDLLSPTNQLIPQTAMSSQIRSGRYDAMTFGFSNSTVVLAGKGTPLSAPPTISANMTLPIPPNGIGDILLVVSFDYSALFSSQPSLSLTLIQASSI